MKTASGPTKDGLHERGIQHVILRNAMSVTAAGPQKYWLRGHLRDIRILKVSGMSIQDSYTRQSISERDEGAAEECVLTVRQ